MSVAPSKLIWKALQWLNAIDPPVGGSTGWTAVAGPMPPDGDKYVSVMDTGAYLLGRVMQTGEQIRKPTFQVMLRSADYGKGMAEGLRITDFLSKIGVLLGWPDGTGGPLPVKVDGEDWAILSVTLMTDVTPIGRTEDRRLNLFSANFAVSSRKLGAGDAAVIWPIVEAT